MIAAKPAFSTLAYHYRAGIFALCALAVLSKASAGTLLPTSPEGYLTQAATLRQSRDRPWAPAEGRLGNLRHVQITAPDCVVRVVSGNENRVFPGTRDVVVVERTRVLDANPNEQPVPRDVVLATNHAQACPGLGSCGLSVTEAKRSSTSTVPGPVCFTVQIATAHDLLLGGEGLSVLVDRVRQPALRIALNPSYDLKLWLEQVQVGLLSIKANASASVAGSGDVDFLQLSSSNSASTAYMHEIRARHVGVTTTTTGTRWSIRIGADTEAGYYQPARAPGRIAELYSIEIDGPIERLDVPVGSVDPRPLSVATREAVRALRADVLARAGPAPKLPASDSTLPVLNAAIAALPTDPRERVAQVVARYLPASVRITDIALWKQGGRLEGIASDATSARDVVRRLTDSGEFVLVSGGGPIARDGGYAFSTQMHFSCDAPGKTSICPPGDPAGLGGYTVAQVRNRLVELLGPTVTVRDVRRDGDAIRLTANAANDFEAHAALERIGQEKGLFRVSISGYGPSGYSSDIDARVKLVCAVPPKPDGICAAQPDVVE